MDSAPLITIGICTYNSSSTIERAVLSALNQTWRSLEIVIVDDCSPDVTWDLLQSLSRVHHELKIFRNRSNSGVAVTRNRILIEAQGEFIAFFDDDDESNPHRLSLQFERIINYESQFADGELLLPHSRKWCIPRKILFREQWVFGKTD